jgi:phage terminase large subunit-like protein
VIYLTTQSDEPPAGVFKERLQYWRDVRDGIIEDRKTLGVLYEFPEEMVRDKAYLEPRNFYLTNPNIGRSVSAEWLEDQLRKNLNKTDGTLQQFLAKHLNVEIGLSLRSDRWAGADFWQAQGRPPVTLQTLIDRCEVIDVGIDGGGLDDLLGFAALGRVADSSEWLLWTHAWAHPSVMERRKSEAPRFLDFARDGDLTIVRQIGDDVAEVADLVAQVEGAGLLDKVGVDQHGLGGILDALDAAEVPADKIVGVSQGWKMNGAIKTAERKLAEGTLIHGGQPLMAWCVGNAKVEPKGNAVSITKQAAGLAKIDPLMATFNAVSLLSLNPAAASGGGFFESFAD